MARKLEIEIVGDSRNFQRALGQASGSASSFGSKLAKFGRFAAAGIAIAGGAAAVAGGKMIGLASDAGEVESKFKIIFGKTVPRLTKQINAFSKATGTSRFELKEQVADLGALLKPIVGNTKETGKMSVAVAKLATDLGSFNNVPTADALLAIRSGLVGEAEPLRRFGVLLNEAAVKSEAVRLGLVKQGEELTEQQKVQARYSLIMKQTTLAQGDAVRTSGSFANQLKRLKSGVKDAATSIGKFLLPIAGAVVGAFNDIIPKIESFLNRIGRAKGFKAKIKVVWLGAKNAAQDLLEAIRTALVGERKPLKLPSGQILEWTETQGLLDKLGVALENANWQKIADKVMGAIGTALSKAENLGRKIAPVIATALVAAFALLLDPAFWIKNWDLALVVASVIFRVRLAKYIGIALKSGLKLAWQGIGDLIYGLTGGAVSRVIPAIVRGLRSIPSTVRLWFRLGMQAIGEVVSGWVRIATTGASRLVSAVGRALTPLVRTVTKPFRDALNAIINLWNRLRIPGFSINLPGPVPDMKFGGFDFPNIPNLASGAVVRARPGGTLIRAGEGGRDEAIIPLNRGGGGLGRPIQVNLLFDRRTLASVLVDIDQERARSNGGRGLFA